MKRSYRKTSILIRICCLFWISFLFFNIDKPAAVNDGNKPIFLNEEVDEIPLTTNLRILKDAEGTLEIEDLLKPPLNWNFVSNEKGIPNVGLSSDVYWLSFTVQDQSEDREWLLEVDNPFLDKVILYSPDDFGEFSAVQLDSTSSDAGESSFYYQPVFQLLPLKEGESTFFVRVESQEAMHLPLTIWEDEAFDAKTRQTTAIIGLFGGLSLLFLACCIYWFFRYRQISFFYLLLLAISVIAVSSTWTNLNLAYIWPELGWLFRQTVWAFFGIAGVLILWINKKLLSENLQWQKLSGLSKTLAAFIFFSSMLSFFFETIAGLFLFLAVLLSLALSFGMSLSVWQKGVPYAASYCLALLLLVTAYLFSFLTAAAVLPYVEVLQFGLYLTSGMVLLLIAKALLAKEKVNVEKNEQLARQEKDRQLNEIEILKNANKRKDELLAYTSNGLRTPLYGMIGIAESLQESAAGKMSPLISNQLNELVASGKNMAHLVNDILDSSKTMQAPLPLHVEPIAVDELCDTVLSLCRPLLRKESVKLYHTVPASLPKVLADPERLQQILCNLIENSIKYTNQGEITVSAIQLNEQLEISVTDTGAGIQENRIPVLFQWNDGVEKLRENKGLGLKIAKNLVELQGGSMKVRSHVGTGSTFSFTLPIHEDELMTNSPAGFESEIKELTASQLADSMLKQRSTKRNLHILVIESEEVNRLVLLRQLLSAGYQAFGAKSGNTAIQLMGSKPVDLIVVSSSLTDMTGDELCRRIRLDYTLTELPILMLSHTDGMREKKEAFTAGANDYLLKPCDKEEFLLRIGTLADMRSLTQEITNLNYFLERNVKERTMALEITNMNLLTVNDEIQEIEKSRNEMLSAISHELGTPITLIHSYIQAVKESLIEENNPRYLDMIHKKLLLLERLTEDLVELTKYKSGNMTLRFEEKELKAWLGRLKDSMASDVSQSGRTFEFLGTDNPDDINDALLAIDLDRLDQVISNIQWNAIKHTSSEEGMIMLSAKIMAKNNEDALLSEEEFDGELVIRISDNGCGINKEALPHIFDRFYKVDSSAGYKGSGLGLAIAKEIILAHKGQIWADSTEGKGSVFIIVLPLIFH
ncbi:response regulator [Planococcus sp. CPCC 101016]|uniref:ATP-binding protein n=1 Tax=Planococcus sp. CPCC 101016 TaxID=2599617 RepID=UPI0011B7A94A|nr:ATP-binding protein [Planococcus sp. CPCC 101016]TWT07187.1 response regulator [Planococcus sp. CPCC 101016]